MIKKLLLLLLLCPMIVSAACNREKHNQYANLDITYNTTYSKSTDSFTITFYSIFKDMYVMNGKTKYTSDSGNTVTISGIKPGSTTLFNVYANDGCEELKGIYFTADYYNPYYGTAECRGYVDKLAICSSQFTEARVTKNVLDTAKENYNKTISDYENPVPEPEPTLFERILEFFGSWGIKIALAVITTVVVTAFFSNKFRKIKHGI